MDRMLDEFKYVNRVVNSCTNDLQSKTAKKWAKNWAKRMKANYPETVPSATDLYLSVISA